jgi:hypothetical protein
MPKLVCDHPDVSEGVEYYTLAGLPEDPHVTYDPGADHAINYELGYLPSGDYSLRVSACNSWQCSLPTPLDFIVPNPPSLPLGLRILFI